MKSRQIIFGRLKGCRKPLLPRRCFHTCVSQRRAAEAGPSMYRDLLQRGYFVAKLPSRSEHALRSLVSGSVWRSLREQAHVAPPADDGDDPTSLGLQLFTDKRPGARMSAFGSAKAIETAAQTLLRRKEQVPAVLDSIYQGAPAHLPMDDLCADFATAATSVARELHSFGDAILHDICKHFVEGVLHENAPGKESFQRDLLLNPRAVSNIQWENETLFNFFTARQCGMYQHTDHSAFTLILLPPDATEHASTDEKSHAGLQVQSPEGVWQDVECIMSEGAVVAVAGHHLPILLSSIALRLYDDQTSVPHAVSQTQQILQALSSLPVAAPHRVVGKRTNVKRVSCAHFVCRSGGAGWAEMKKRVMGLRRDALRS